MNELIREAEQRVILQGLLEEAKAFYRNEENLQAYEAWKKEEKNADHSKL